MLATTITLVATATDFLLAITSCCIDKTFAILSRLDFAIEQDNYMSNPSKVMRRTP